jgi:hypothetical protein
MGYAATVVVEYKDLLARTEALVREFQPGLSAGTVIRAVTRCRAELLEAGVRHGLASAAEDRARAELTGITGRRAAVSRATRAAARRARPRAGRTAGRAGRRCTR